MKRILILSTCLLLVLTLILPEIVSAKSKQDKGPLSKKVFIHYRKPRGKPDNPGKPTKPPKDEGSYTYIARGMKWKTAEDYVLNPLGAPAGSLAAIGKAMDTWDDEVSFTIFGALSQDDNVQVDLDPVGTDGANAIVFVPLGDPQIIAVTYVWGYYNAPPKFREIVEVDMIFNTGSDWTWGDADFDSTAMDVLNIATHEFGHAAGMGDLYETPASEETMFGYSQEGEIKKRDLYIGDIAGIRNLYK